MLNDTRTDFSDLRHDENAGRNTPAVCQHLDRQPLTETWGWKINTRKGVSKQQLAAQADFGFCTVFSQPAELPSG